MRERIRKIIFDHDTPTARWFDIVLLCCISVSVIAVILESVESVRVQFGPMLVALEWFFTIVFTLEYLVRLLTVTRPLRYAFSFFGIVDLVAVLPSYLALVLPGAQYFLIIRILRFLRVFRILKLVRFLGEAQILMRALRVSSPKIIVFLAAVVTIVVIVGALMFAIEGPAHGFTNIPVSMYWAIVTVTTVGYGDIIPTTIAGKFLAALLMLMGYGIIAVPTGIVTASLAQVGNYPEFACPHCGEDGHDPDADFCKYCGGELPLYEDREGR